jgi:hypothetical protein
MTPLFHERDYDARFWIGRPEQRPPWSADCWSSLRSALDALVAIGRAPIHVHTSQINLQSRKHARFGKLAWSVAADAKWVHHSDERCFENVEVWAPAPRVCVSEGRSPDVYFDLSNLQGAAGFEWFIICAAATDLGKTAAAEALAGVSEAINRELGAVPSAESRRPWGYSFGRAFTDGMQEVSADVAFRLAREGSFDLALPKLRGSWRRSASAG